MLIIGGDGPGKRKRDRIGGGDDYEDESEPSNDEGGGMDMDAKKTEAARLLVKALGASPEATTRVKKALEAFVYACTDEGE
jgi:hypothetical protein